MATTTEEEEGKGHIIPTDLLTGEILSRIPAVELFKKFRLVSREWRRIISSPEFIRIHLKKSNQRSDGTRFLHTYLFEMTDYPSDHRIPNPLESLSLTGRSAKILGSCDGLICFCDEDSKKLSVFNPSTRQYTLHLATDFFSYRATQARGRYGCETLPTAGCENLTTGYASWFGRHPCTGEYALVVGSCDTYSHFDVHVYLLKTHVSRSWIHQRKGYTFFDARPGKLYKGAIHWAASTTGLLHFSLRPHLNYITNDHVIVAYNFRSNEILEIPAPGEFQFTLGVLDEYLFAISKDVDKVFELWTMREYGVKESWIKFAKVDGSFVGFRFLVPLGSSSNGDNVIADAEKFSFIDKAITLFKKHDFEGSNIISYVDSLVPPEIIYE